MVREVASTRVAEDVAHAVQALVPLQALHGAVELRAAQPLDSVGCVAEQRRLLGHGQPCDDVPGARARWQGRVAEGQQHALGALRRRAGPVNVGGDQADKIQSAHQHRGLGVPVRRAGTSFEVAREDNCGRKTFIRNHKRVVYCRQTHTEKRAAYAVDDHRRPSYAH